MPEKSVVLLSGGVDSTTCLALALFNAKNVPERVIALSFNYGQKHTNELERAKKVAEYYGVRHIIVDIDPSIFDAGRSTLLKNSAREIEHGAYSEQLARLGGEGTVDTYVPFRNGLMLSYACALAYSNEIENVYFGAHADDAAGRAYPDCTPAFAQAIRESMEEGTSGKVTLKAPFIHLFKHNIVEVGLSLGVPYELTWSCYEGKDEPCGECGTCIDRARAFERNGIEDPAIQNQNMKVRKPQ